MVKASELARELKVTIRTLYVWAKKGLITFTKGPTGRNYISEKEYTRIMHGKEQRRTQSI